VHPEFDYSLLAVESRQGEELLLLASELAGSVLQRAGATQTAELARVKGAALEGLVLRQPVLRTRGAGEFLGGHVTLDSGTRRRAHGARHGQEDFIVGQRYGLPVDKPGAAATAGSACHPAFEARRSSTANPHVVDVLAAHGTLCTTNRSATAIRTAASPNASDLPCPPRSWFIRHCDAGGAARRGARGDPQGHWIARLGEPRITA